MRCPRPPPQRLCPSMCRVRAGPPAARIASFLPRLPLVSAAPLCVSRHRRSCVASICAQAPFDARATRRERVGGRRARDLEATLGRVRRVESRRAGRLGGRGGACVRRKGVGPAALEIKRASALRESLAGELWGRSLQGRSGGLGSTCRARRLTKLGFRRKPVPPPWRSWMTRRLLTLSCGPAASSVAGNTGFRPTPNPKRPIPAKFVRSPLRTRAPVFLPMSRDPAGACPSDTHSVSRRSVPLSISEFSGVSSWWRGLRRVPLLRRPLHDPQRSAGLSAEAAYAPHFPQHSSPGRLVGTRFLGRSGAVARGCTGRSYILLGGQRFWISRVDRTEGVAKRRGRQEATWPFLTTKPSSCLRAPIIARAPEARAP